MKNIFDRWTRRRLKNFVMLGLTVVATAIALVPLFSILIYVAVRGLQALNWDFFTQLPKPVGEPGGGMANAIVGTLTLVVLGSLVSLPVGMLTGIYLAEFGRGKLAWLVRFICDVLTGIPSIIIGIFVYTLVVVPMHRFSALAGGLALGILMVPVIARVTEDMLRMVPKSLREASLSLGATQARTTVSIVLRSASGGIITGIMLTLSRAAGETAPLLFTALNNRYWHSGLDQPIASLPVYIYTYAISPYPDWQGQAWGAALVLVIIILVTSIIARLASRKKYFGWN
ncbi:MAG: phosphate transport system permease protein [Clostridia bacterium]|nr:phosphate transport system permease protein [Clostridia bacterium]